MDGQNGPISLYGQIDKRVHGCLLMVTICQLTSILSQIESFQEVCVKNEIVAKITRASNGFMEARILIAGVELGVFDLLARAAHGAEEIARELGLSVRGVRILSDALVAHGYLEKKDGQYRNVSELEPYLVRGRDGSHAYILGHRANMFKKWARLDETIRTGQPVQEENLDSLRNRESNRNFIMGMAEVSKGRLGPILDRLPLEDGFHFVDVGGGPAQYVCEACKRFPGLKATLVDLPMTIDIAREQVEKHGLSDRVQTLVCDFFSEDEISLQEPADVVLISNVIHAEGPRENRELFNKVYAIMRKGATVAVVENLVEGDRTHPKQGAMFAVNMLAVTPRGRTYTAEEINEWFKTAGFVPLSCEKLESRTWMLLAKKEN